MQRKGLIECTREGKTMRLYLDLKYEGFRDTTLEYVPPVDRTRLGIQLLKEDKVA